MITKLSNLTLDAKKNPYPYLMALDKDIKNLFILLSQGVTETTTIASLTGKNLTLVNGLLVSPTGTV